VKRAGPGAGAAGGGPGGDGSGAGGAARGEDGVVGVDDWEICIEVEEGLMETEVDAEVTEVRWEAVEDDTWLIEVVMGTEEVLLLETEATAEGLDSLTEDTEDAAEEAVALTITCVCLWSAIYLWTGCQQTTYGDNFYDKGSRSPKYCRCFKDCRCFKYC